MLWSEHCWVLSTHPEVSGAVTMLDLGRYVSKRVPVLTDSKQLPLLMAPAGGLVDFPFAADSH